MSTKLSDISRTLRYHILEATTQAGSGHPTSALSAVELMATLMFGGTFHYDSKNPENPNNDRLIFSKGHAAPLLYALWAVAGAVPFKELATLRTLGSTLEGHPTTDFLFAEAATGSLGQGLSIGVGMALNAQYLDRLPYKTYVLLGDSEMAEGSNWEAMALASHYKLSQLVAILDVNRLGQRGETLHGHTVAIYEQKATAFGWHTINVDGHNFQEIQTALEQAQKSEKPTMIIAKTFKGKGISLLEDQPEWHGRALSSEQLETALVELGDVQKELTVTLPLPTIATPTQSSSGTPTTPQYDTNQEIAPREAYGSGLVTAMQQNPQIVALDAEVSNSTGAETVTENLPDRFFEMYIAEQNMIGAAIGLSQRGKIPFASTFAAFLTRAFDQLRMAQYSQSNIKVVGSHVGVSIGEDGPSQMGLEDISMMRSIPSATVFYPSDAVSMDKLVAVAAQTPGIVYLRSTRAKLPILYDVNEEFMVGGLKILKESTNDTISIVTAGITLHEALKAYDLLLKEGIHTKVVDLYSIQPLDSETLSQIAAQTPHIIVVEDHYPNGGMGEAVAKALTGKATIHHKAISKTPHSGKPEELLAFYEIDSHGIYTYVKNVLEIL